MTDNPFRPVSWREAQRERDKQQRRAARAVEKMTLEELAELVATRPQDDLHYEPARGRIFRQLNAMSDEQLEIRKWDDKLGSFVRDTLSNRRDLQRRRAEWEEQEKQRKAQREEREEKERQEAERKRAAQQAIREQTAKVREPFRNWTLDQLLAWEPELGITTHAEHRAIIAELKLRLSRARRHLQWLNEVEGQIANTPPIRTVEPTPLRALERRRP